MTNIFVGNLSFDTTDSDLLAAFGAFGAVERATVVRDRDTNHPRGFGFVEMTNAGEVSQAIAGLNRQDLNGRTLNVNEARSGGQGRKGAGGSDRRRQSRW